jgi:predicted nucleic acid-binding protein
LEIEEHKIKLQKISGYSDIELNKTISLITSKIRFININLIPNKILLNTEIFLKDIDVDDTEFVALTNHMHGRLWSGDKNLKNGLLEKGWSKFITTHQLFEIITKKKQ